MQRRRQEQRALRAARRRSFQAVSSSRGNIFRFAAWLDEEVETNPVVRLLGLAFAVFGGLVLVGTGFQIIWDYEARQEDRIFRAYETLSSTASGNRGQGAAATYLLAQGHSLEGLDLSCRTSGELTEILKRTLNDELYGCGYLPIIDGIVSENTDLYNWNLSGTIISNLRISGAWLDGVFKGTEFNRIKLSDSGIYGDLNGATIFDSKFERSRIRYWGDPDAIDPFMYIYYSDISGLRIDTGHRRYFIVTQDNYAWADRPPSILEARLHQPCYEGEELRCWTTRGVPMQALTGVQYCDPLARTDMGGPVENLVEGLTSEMRTDKVNPNCRSMTASEARKRFPLAWRHIMNDGPR